MLGDTGDTATLILRGASLVVAVLLVIGLATPLAGMGDAAIQIGIVLVGRGFGSLSVVATALGLALAMLGPGAWSVEQEECFPGCSRLFSRLQQKSSS